MVLNKFVASLATVFTLLVGVFLISNGLGIGVLEGEYTFWGLGEMAAGLAMIAGVFLVSRSPRLGTTLVIVAAIAAAASHYWMLVIGVPVAIVIILGSLARGGGFRKSDAPAV